MSHLKIQKIINKNIKMNKKFIYKTTNINNIKKTNHYINLPSHLYKKIDYDDLVSILDDYINYPNDIIEDNKNYIILNNVNIIHKTRYLLFNDNIYIDKIKTDIIKLVNKNHIFHEYFVLLKLNDLVKINMDKICLNLSSTSSNNYCHFLVETLAFLITFLKNSNKDISEFNIVISDIFCKKMLEELFDNISIILTSSDKIYNGKIIIPKIYQTYNFSWNKVNIPRQIEIYNIESEQILNVREFIFKKFNIVPECKNKLYLKRKNVLRKIINIDDVEKIIYNNNYIKTIPDNMTLNEQVNIFSKCSHFITQAGAGTANLIFLPANCVINILVADNDFVNYDYFRKIAESINLNITYIYCKPMYKYDDVTINNNIEFICKNYDLTCHPMNADYYFTIEHLNELNKILSIK